MTVYLGLTGSSVSKNKTYSKSKYYKTMKIPKMNTDMVILADKIQMMQSSWREKSENQSIIKRRWWTTCLRHWDHRDNYIKKSQMRWKLSEKKSFSWRNIDHIWLQMANKLRQGNMNSSRLMIVSKRHKCCRITRNIWLNQKRFYRTKTLGPILMIWSKNSEKLLRCFPSIKKKQNRSRMSCSN